MAISRIPAPVRRLLIKMMRGRSPQSRRRRTAAKICIFKHDRLGDLILAVGAIRYLQQEYGPENCTLLVSTIAGSFARELFSGSTIIELPPAHNDLLAGVLPALFNQRKWLSRVRFEKLISLRHQRNVFHELLLSHIAADEFHAVANVPQTILSSNIRAYEFPLAHPIAYPTKAPLNYCIELEGHRRVIEQATGNGVTIEQILPRLEFARTGRENFVLIAPFGSTPIRTYPTPLFVEAMKRIQDRHGCTFLVSGAPADAPQLQEFSRHAEKSGVRNVSPCTPSSFLNFCSVVASARGVISVETSTAHLAVALDKPAVVIIGGGQYGQFGPWQRSDRQVWLTNQIPCFGCNWSCIYPEAYCITQVSPALIANSLIERL
jgi:ADP-heptose:LPS heptosyltransferase